MAIRFTIAGIDRTAYLDRTSNFTWNLMKGSRGSCTIPLRMTGDNFFEPVAGDAIFIYDINTSTSPGVETCVWCGTLQERAMNWTGNQGLIRWTLSGVTFEQLFDAVQFTNFKTTEPIGAGDLLTLLFGIAGGDVARYLTLGTIDIGATILPGFEVSRMSDALNTFATDSNFVWYVDPADQKVYFQLANARAAAWELDGGVLWNESGDSSLSWKESSTDFRDKQVVQLTGAAKADLTPQTSVFPGDDATLSFTLPTTPSSITSFQVTRSTQATASGFFTDNAVDGDTVSIGSGSLQYTFVTTLNNTAWGQVLIEATAADTLQNLVDAINAKASEAGVTYSLPTWANPLVQAFALSSPPLTMAVTAKAIGDDGNGIALSQTTAVSPIGFTWIDFTTSGGSTVDFGVGGFSFSWDGSLTVTASPAVPTGCSFVVKYIPSGSGTIALSGAGIANLPHVTQNYTLSKATTREGVLLGQQAILAAFGILPAQAQLDTDKPGLTICRDLTINIDKPTGVGLIMNGHWIISEVSATLIAGMDQRPEPYGHFRYTVYLINTLEVQNFVQAWEQLTNIGPSASQDVTPPVPNTPPQTPAGREWVQEIAKGNIDQNGFEVAMQDADTVIGSDAYAFQDPEDVGKIITIAAATGWTPGQYTIVSVSGGLATLSSSPAAAFTTGGTASLVSTTVFQLTWAPMVSSYTGNQIAIVSLVSGGVTHALTPFRYAQQGFVIDPIDPDLGPDYTLSGQTLTLKANISLGDFVKVEYFPEGSTTPPPPLPSGEDLASEDGSSFDVNEPDMFIADANELGTYHFQESDVGKHILISGASPWPDTPVSYLIAAVFEGGGAKITGTPYVAFPQTGGIWQITA